MKINPALTINNLKIFYTILLLFVIRTHLLGQGVEKIVIKYLYMIKMTSGIAGLIFLILFVYINSYHNTILITIDRNKKLTEKRHTY